MPTATTIHVHEWLLVAVEYDDFGTVRAYECQSCSAVRYQS